MHTHYILHKPYGYLSQFVNQHKKRRNKKMLGELHDFVDKTMSIGRLDYDSEGLLLLTTDGMLSYNILSRNVEKEYHVQVDGIVSQENADLLEKGVDIQIEGKTYSTLPCKVKILNPPPNHGIRKKKIRDDRHGPTSWLSITIREGKYRQVRKMTASIGHPTLRLVRVRIGKINLNSLQSGEVKQVETLNY